MARVPNAPPDLLPLPAGDRVADLGIEKEVLHLGAEAHVGLGVYAINAPYPADGRPVAAAAS